MNPGPDDLLERVRTIALALPGAIEKISHGAPVFFIEKGRSFAWFWQNHHGDGHLAVIVKTSGPDEQQMLIETDPDLYFRPPYLWSSGWIGLEIGAGATDWEHIADWIEKSWRRVAPRKLLEKI